MYQNAAQMRVPLREAQKTMRLMGLNQDTADVVYMPLQARGQYEVPRSDNVNRTGANEDCDQHVSSVQVGQKRRQDDQHVGPQVCDR